jgi:peptidoglycan hydrolase-like protein with peptidoglycan-binding domain
MSNSATLTREQMRTVYAATELGGRAGDSNHFSYAGLAKSTYSFGLMQFDVGNNDDAKDFLAANGFDAADIKDLKSHGGLSREKLDALNIKLQAIPQAKIDQFTNDYLDQRLARVGSVIDQVRALKPEAADAIVQDPKLQLGIADYANQFGHVGPQVINFLAGKSETLDATGVTVKAGSPVTREDIQTFIGATGYGHDPANARGVAGREKHFNQAMDELGLGSGAQSRQRSTEFTAHPGSLRQGDRGEAVGIVQQELRDLGYTDAKGRPLTVDKDFGTSTTAAIKAFQSEHDLTSDGIVGKDTANVLTQQVDALQKSQGPSALNAPNAADVVRDRSVNDAFEAIRASTDRRDVDGTSAPTISGANRLPNGDQRPTLDRAEPAPAMARAPHDLRNPDHPQHANYEKVSGLVADAYAKHGMSLQPEQLERVTAQVMLDAQMRPVKDIKEVHLDPDPGTRHVHANSNVMAFSGDPHAVTTLRCSTDVQQARQTPPEHNFQQLAQVHQQQAQIAQQQAQNHTQGSPGGPNGPGMGGR